MKGATECAKRFRALIKSLRGKLGKTSQPPTGDPVEQLFLGIFTRDAQESKAREAYDKLRAIVVDFNELRVIPSLELTEELGDYPDARHKCEDLSRALNRIFWLEHSVSLERLRKGSRKDVVTYLDRIDGLEPYSRARIRLLGLGQHAFPLDEAMLGFLRREELVDSKATLDEAQSFLERHVSEDEAIEVFSLLRKHAWSEMDKAVRKGEVEKIKSVPPDRTTRNMLRTVAEQADHGPVEDDLLDPPDLPEGDFGGLDGDVPGLAEGLIEDGAEAGKPRKGKTKGGKGDDAKKGRLVEVAKSSRKKPEPVGVVAGKSNGKPAAKSRHRPAKAK